MRRDLSPPRQLVLSGMLEEQADEVAAGHSRPSPRAGALSERGWVMLLLSEATLATVGVRSL